MSIDTLNDHCVDTGRRVSTDRPGTARRDAERGDGVDRRRRLGQHADRLDRCLVHALNDLGALAWTGPSAEYAFERLAECRLALADAAVSLRALTGGESTAHPYDHPGATPATADESITTARRNTPFDRHVAINGAIR